VEGFLAEDPEFARTLQRWGDLVVDRLNDVSPPKFFATAAVAAVFWVAFFVRLFRGRREVLVRVRR
jgi:hypothetical protein